MKKILRSTAIISALAIMLTGCSEQGNSRVLDIYGGTQSSTQNSPLAQNRVQSEMNENTEIAPTLAEPPIITANGEETPRDFIPDEAYDADDALRAIVETAQTVEILKDKIAEFNEEYPGYAVSGVEVTHYGEPVTTGLLKNGMSISFLYDGGGSLDCAVVRAPKDIIPDEFYAADNALRAIVETAQTVEILKEKIAEYNGEYPGYAVSGVEVTHYGEPVTTGLLKNGMSISFLYDGGGSLDCAVVRAPKDIIPDESYAANDALLAIIETAQTVEVLNEKIAEFNEEYPSYAVSSVEITHYGEPVTTGLLKNGMSIRILYNGDGWLECAVVRAPKDIIPG